MKRVRRYVLWWWCFIADEAAGTQAILGGWVVWPEVRGDPAARRDAPAPPEVDRFEERPG